MEKQTRYKKTSQSFVFCAAATTVVTPASCLPNNDKRVLYQKMQHLFVSVFILKRSNSFVFIHNWHTCNHIIASEKKKILTLSMNAKQLLYSVTVQNWTVLCSYFSFRKKCRIPLSLYHCTWSSYQALAEGCFWHLSRQCCEVVLFLLVSWVSLLCHCKGFTLFLLPLAW